MAGAEHMGEAGGERVLVVDDEDAIRQLVVTVLSDNGYDATGAADGVAAMVLLQDPVRRWDLVLTDIRMPRMNGVELGHRARALHPGLRVLLMTGSAVEHLDGRRFPFALLGKPFRIADLLAMVRRILDDPPA